MKRLIYFLTIITFISCSSDKVSKQLLDKNENLISTSFHFIEGQYLLNPAKTLTCYNKSEKLLNKYNVLKQKIMDNQFDTELIQEFINFLENSEAIIKGLYQREDFNLKNESLLLYQIQNLTYQGLQNLKWKINETQHVTNLTRIITIKKQNYIECYPVSVDTNFLPTLMIGRLIKNTKKFESSFFQTDFNAFNPEGLNIQIEIKDLKKMDLKDKIEGLYINKTVDGKLDTTSFSNRIE